MARGHSLETRLLHLYQLLSLKSAGLLVFLTLYIQIRGRTLRAIYSTKSYQPLGFGRTVKLHIIHKRMAWLKDSTTPFSSCCLAMLKQKMIGKNFCRCWCLHIAQLHTLQLTCHPLNWCLGDHHAPFLSKLHASLIPLHWKANESWTSYHEGFCAG